MVTGYTVGKFNGLHPYFKQTSGDILIEIPDER
jgi:hypothetical protein